MDSRLRTALTLARQAGGIIRDNFGKSLGVDFKEDDSPVTAIDKQINSLVISTLKDAYPDDGVVGEEESASTGHERYQWICDPIDGTKPFILGLPTCIFMLALSEQNVMMMSVVYDPHTDRMYHAIKGEGAYCNGNRISVSNTSLADGFALVGSTSFRYAEALSKAARGVEPVAGIGFKCMMIASGQGVGMINESGSIYDVGPGALMIEEAGGRVTDLAGNPLIYQRKLPGLIMSNGVAHDALLRVVQGESFDYGK